MRKNHLLEWLLSDAEVQVHLIAFGIRLPVVLWWAEYQIRNSWHATEPGCSDYKGAPCGKQASCASPCGPMDICVLKLVEIDILNTNHTRLDMIQLYCAP